jgi:hypothetical protein
MGGKKESKRLKEGGDYLHVVNLFVFYLCLTTFLLIAM